MTIKCPICGGTLWDVLELNYAELGVGDSSSHLDTGNLQACKGCGLVRFDHWRFRDYFREEIRKEADHDFFNAITEEK